MQLISLCKWMPDQNLLRVDGIKVTFGHVHCKVFWVEACIKGVCQLYVYASLLSVTHTQT